MAQGDFLKNYLESDEEFLPTGIIDSSINHRKKIAALVASIFLTIMATLGVALVLSGIFAPFGASMLGAVYLAASLGGGSAVIAGACAFFSAKFSPTSFNSKKSKNIVIATSTIVGIFIGASLGALLTAAGLLMAAPALLPAIGIACGFAFLGAIVFRALGKKISNCILLSTDLKAHREAIDDSDKDQPNPSLLVRHKTEKHYGSPLLTQGIKTSSNISEELSGGKSELSETGHRDISNEGRAARTTFR